MDRLTWSYTLVFLVLLLLYSQSSAKLCSHDESSALLQFKQLFSFENGTYDLCNGIQQSSQKMMSWKEDNDCCSWDGVTCDTATGHVVGLDLSCSWLYGNIPSSSSLFLLTHLRKLNLAYNRLTHSLVSPGFSKFPVLTHLNISSSNFTGRLPSEISHLSKLVSLDLSYNDGVKIETPVWKGLAQNLTNLKEIILDYVDMSSIEPGSFTNLTSSLMFLRFSSCQLQEHFPESILSLPNLQKLELASNFHLTPTVFPKNVNWSTSLRVLDLSGCNLIGSIPASIGNLTQLSYIDFSLNQLTGPIPSSVSKLRNLTAIYLSHNSVNGIVPPELFALPSLEQIVLNDNQLSGSIPSSIFELVNLTYLDLSHNSLSGILELSMFSKLKNLEVLYLSHNRLSLSNKLKVNSSFPNIHWLGLSACNITEFPDILRTQHQLQWLEFQENRVHGRIPNWMSDVGKDTLFHLNFSHNFLTGITEQIPWRNLGTLDVSSNWLQGSLMILPPFMRFLSVSNNQLTGEIPSSYSNLSFIEFLDLSNNSLSGNIPKDIANSKQRLSVLHLQKNNFTGSIPQFFTNSLTTLILNGNQLEGALPSSLVNCTKLEVLDVGNNKINDTFPHWLADLSELQVLIFRSNKFHGPIANSNTRFPFSKLRILDLSRNKFTGVFPTRYFQNFEAMMQGDNNSVKAEYMNSVYSGDYYSVTLTLKGSDIIMERVLTIFTTIDLSSNQFQGEVPNVVGKLNSLKGLNLSHNSLTGPIPPSLGNLKALESLDLSSNELVGEIPGQLTSLDFLQVLNLSENQLVGRIPQTNHFDTFPSSSYSGNLGLCGFPLSNCGEDEAREPRTFHGEEDETSSLFNWKFAIMGYATGLVIGLTMGYIVFTTGRPLWFVWMVEKKQYSKKVRRRGRGSSRNSQWK